MSEKEPDPPPAKKQEPSAMSGVRVIPPRPDRRNELLEIRKYDFDGRDLCMRSTWKIMLTSLKTGETTKEFSNIKQEDLQHLFMVAAEPSEAEKSCLLSRPGLKNEVLTGAWHM
jgi:hypothetical protein